MHHCSFRVLVHYSLWPLAVVLAREESDAELWLWGSFLLCRRLLLLLRLPWRLFQLLASLSDAGSIFLRTWLTYAKVANTVSRKKNPREQPGKFSSVGPLCSKKLKVRPRLGFLCEPKHFAVFYIGFGLVPAADPPLNLSSGKVWISVYRFWVYFLRLLYISFLQ